jgi:hypothetical protein
VLVAKDGGELPEYPAKYPNETNGEANLLSFVIRLWREDSDSDEQINTWRGHITPVPTGERHYFRNIGEIPDLILAHLKMQK